MESSTSSSPTWHKSACNLCYINCGVELAVAGQGADARIVKVRGDRDNPRSQGYLCNKAQAIPSYVHHRDRLTSIGIVPTILPVESRNSPVRRCVKYPERHKNLCVLAQISGWF